MTIHLNIGPVACALALATVALILGVDPSALIVAALVLANRQAQHGRERQ